MTGQPYLPAYRVAEVPPHLLRRRTSALTWVTMTVLGLGAVVIAVVLLLTGGPATAILTTLLAAVSFPLLIAVCFWLDRYEPEPGRYRLAALGWGAVVAVILSFFAEQLLFSLPGTDDFVDTAVIAPFVEEFGKGLFLVVVVLFRRAQVHGLLDGIVYAALVGIGFAFVEDILYYTASLSEAADRAHGHLRAPRRDGPLRPPTVHLRARGRDRDRRQHAVAAAALAGAGPRLPGGGAAARHLERQQLRGAQGFLLAYAAVMLPLLVIVLALAIWARVREGRMLTTALEQTTALGWTRPEEIRWVARLSDRMSSRSYARRVGGRPAMRTLRAFQQTLTEIAFLHLRALDGTAPGTSTSGCWCCSSTPPSSVPSSSCRPRRAPSCTADRDQQPPATAVPLPRRSSGSPRRIRRLRPPTTRRLRVAGPASGDHGAAGAVSLALAGRARRSLRRAGRRTEPGTAPAAGRCAAQRSPAVPVRDAGTGHDRPGGSRRHGSRPARPRTLEGGRGAARRAAACGRSGVGRARRGLPGLRCAPGGRRLPTGAGDQPDPAARRLRADPGRFRRRACGAAPADRGAAERPLPAPAGGDRRTDTRHGSDLRAPRGRQPADQPGRRPPGPPGRTGSPPPPSRRRRGCSTGFPTWTPTATGSWSTAWALPLTSWTDSAVRSPRGWTAPVGGTRTRPGPASDSTPCSTPVP